METIVFAVLLTGLLTLPTYHSKCISSSSDCYQLSEDNYDVFQEERGNLFSSCIRECDGKSRTCYYQLHVEPYSTMGPACGDCPRNKSACYDPQCITADGVERGVYVYNRMLPGPSIQVCKGDKVIIDVTNADGHRSTTVHWHGIRQIGSQYYDGVPMVTQCPINPGETFRYQFHVEQPGTYFYHSHSGVQKIDGLSGAFIVRDQKSSDVNGHLYDFDLPEHILLIQDWIHGVADQKVPGLTKGPESGSLPKSYLINGRGIYIGTSTDPELLISQVNSPTQPPISEFIVKPGKKYRFRIIASTCLACTLRVTVQQHKLSTIYADGAGPINPVEVDTMTLNSGDRFDVVIDAKNDVGSYWILVRGEGSCNNVMQLALLKYEGSHNAPPSNLPIEVKDGVILNPSNPTCDSSKQVCLSSLTAPRPAPTNLQKGKNYKRLLFKFGFHSYSISELFQSNSYNPYFEPEKYILVRGQINAITNKLAASPLLSQYNDIPKDAYCEKKCQEEHLNCVCLNVYKVPLNTFVDIIVADTAEYSPTGPTHPFHLHGYNFYVLKEGIFRNGLSKGINEINDWLDNDAITNNTNPIQKDSISVPTSGYVVIRFYADNPGFWILHCHFTLHLDLGMSAILQVGEPDEVPSPPQGFPKCGNFLPPIA